MEPTIFHSPAKFKKWKRVRNELRDKIESAKEVDDSICIDSEPQVSHRNCYFDSGEVKVSVLAVPLKYHIIVGDCQFHSSTISCKIKLVKLDSL